MRAVVRMPMWFRPKLKRALRQAGIELRWHRQVLMTLGRRSATAAPAAKSWLGWQR